MIDDTIDEIYCYKYARLYFLKGIIYNIFTLGIISLICKFSAKVFIKIYCIECDVSRAELFLVVDFENNIFLVKTIRENFHKKYKFLKNDISYNQSIIEVKNSHYIGEEMYNSSDECIILKFKNNNYIYLESIKRFAPVQLDLQRFTNSAIHDLFSVGITKLTQYNYLLNKFGENNLKVKARKFLNILFKKFFSPLILYRIFMILIWIVQGYYSFLAVIAVLSFIILILSSYQKYINYKRIFTDNKLADIPRIDEVNKILIF